MAATTMFKNKIKEISEPHHAARIPSSKNLQIPKATHSQSLKSAELHIPGSPEPLRPLESQELPEPPEPQKLPVTKSPGPRIPEVLTQISEVSRSQDTQIHEVPKGGPKIPSCKHHKIIQNHVLSQNEQAERVNLLLLGAAIIFLIHATSLLIIIFTKMSPIDRQICQCVLDLNSNQKGKLTKGNRYLLPMKLTTTVNVIIEYFLKKLSKYVILTYLPTFKKAKA